MKFKELCNIVDGEFSDKFKKKFKKYNEIIEDYLPGKKGSMKQAKEERSFNYDNRDITDIFLFGEYGIKTFKEKNPGIRDLEDNKYYNLCCVGLLTRQIMHKSGKKLAEKGFDRVVLWGRDSALIPGSKDIKYYIAGESSLTYNGKYYKPLKNYINFCYEMDIFIDEENMKKQVLEKIDLDEKLEAFNNKIDNFINENSCFFDTGFTGVQMFRTKVFLNKNVPIYLMSKNTLIGFAKKLGGISDDEVVLVEMVEKPVAEYKEFDKTEPNYLKIIKENEGSVCSKVIENHIDKVVFTHLGFECFDKEKENIEKKVSKYI